MVFPPTFILNKINSLRPLASDRSAFSTIPHGYILLTQHGIWTTLFVRYSKMKSKIIILLIAIVFSVSVGSAEDYEVDGVNDSVFWEQRKKESETALEAYKAFSEGRFREALTLFQKLKVSPDKRMSIESLREMVKNRVRLGKIKPKVVYKVLVLRIDNMELHPRAGGTIEASISEQSQAIHDMYMGMAKHTYESFSNGEMTIQFDVVKVKDPLVAVYYDQDFETFFPRLDLLKGVTKILRKRSKDFDLLCLLWPGNMSNTYAGGSWNIPYVYDVLYGPKRGRLILPDHANFGVWVHELFHSFEGHADIQVMHGYYEPQRKNFPKWKGKTGDQFDFFKWQFETSIMKKPWNSYLYRELYTQDHSEAVFTKIVKAYEGTDVLKLNDAQRFTNDAQLEQDLKKKRKILTKVFKVSPYDNTALIEYMNLCIAEGDLKEAERAAKKLLETVPISARHWAQLASLYSKNGQTAKIPDVYKQCAKSPFLPDHDKKWCEQVVKKYYSRQ